MNRQLAALLVLSAVLAVWAASLAKPAMASDPRDRYLHWRRPDFDVVVVPFANRSTRESVDHVNQAVQEAFMEHKLRVVPRSSVDTYLKRTGLGGAPVLTEPEQHALARAMSARYVLTGTIKQYRADKKFRLGGFLLSPIGGAATTYGTVELSSQVYDQALKKIVWDQSYKTTKKQQVFGTFASRERVVTKALKQAVEELYKTCFPLLR
ncbi:MAG: hypothetical protein HY815_29900 [Candidatus Riflebacteria bacterium]|nr:hypothetical protein [Candidatus Riflebacteria bacterium]